MHIFIKDQCKKWYGGVQYMFACLRNYYPCKVVAQSKDGEAKETKILYTIFGKTTEHPSTANEIISNPELLNKFKPTQAAMLGAISAGDLLLATPEKERKQKFEEMKVRCIPLTDADKQAARDKPAGFSKIKLILTVLFIAAHMTYFTMAPRILYIFSLYVPGGILIFPFTFPLSDIITESYGYDYAKCLIWCVLGALGIFTFFTWVSMTAPTAVLDYGYKAVFLNYPRLYLGVVLATFVSFFVNNAIISKLKIKMDGKKFWVRSLISTAVGHALFSIIWVTVFHIGEISAQYIMKLVLGMYVWKMLFELLATPAAAYLAAWIKVKEGRDPYDYDTKFNPFSF